MGLVEKLTIGERLKARKIAKQVLETPTPDLLEVRERLYDKDLIELVDQALSLRGIEV